METPVPISSLTHGSRGGKRERGRAHFPTRRASVTVPVPWTGLSRSQKYAFLRAGGPHPPQRRGAVRPWRRKPISNSPSALQGLAGWPGFAPSTHTAVNFESIFSRRSLRSGVRPPVPNGISATQSSSSSPSCAEKLVRNLSREGEILVSQLQIASPTIVMPPTYIRTP